MQFIIRKGSVIPKNRWALWFWTHVSQLVNETDSVYFTINVFRQQLVDVGLAK